MVNHANRTQMMRALLALRELLLSGEFKPGDRMSELPLVERLGVSRTPLRLALVALEHEGLLRVLPTGGYVVREFTQADMRHAIELRGVDVRDGVGFPIELHGDGPGVADDVQVGGDETICRDDESGAETFALSVAAAESLGSPEKNQSAA